MRVIFDTNVLVSAALKADSQPSRAWLWAAQHATILASATTAKEIHTVFQRPKFDRFLSQQQRTFFLFSFDAEAEIIPITRTITLCRDPKDNKFLELAVCGAADYLITGDDDLLALHPFEATSILTPAQFLAIITA